MLGFNGGRIGTTNATAAGPLSASGLWLPAEQSTAKGRGAWPLGPTEVPAIGESFLGGFFAGYISHTANGVATHALIVAPRSTGYVTSRTWGPEGNNVAGSVSSFDGAANTAAMVALGIATYPAAKFCVDLTIGGYTDWYLPSRFEHEIAYFHLKPTTAANNTSYGANPYAVPPRASNYTAGNPAITSVSLFTTTEAFAGENPYWSSTQSSSSAALEQVYQGPFAGRQVSQFKSSNFQVRAFRRFAL